MNLRSFLDDENILWEALFFSAVLHLAFMHVGDISFRFQQKHPVEIDITSMGHLGMTGSRHPASAPTPRPAVPPKQWTKAAPNQKVIPAVVPTTPAPAPAPEEPWAPSGPVGTGTGEYGIGTGDGSENSLSRIPQIVNLSDLNAILKKYYPEEARAQHKEGAVTLDLHIDTEGHVQSIDVVRSGGAAFDTAAQRVAKLLRFTPAFVGSQRVAVRMRQTIQFKLQES